MKIKYDASEVGEMHQLLEEVTPQAAQWAVNQAAEQTRSEMVLAIQRGPATGKVYEKYNPRRTHQASAPGEAPMSDTGDLARHITTDQQNPSSVKRLGNVGAAAGAPDGFEYADFLEFGTDDMEPRPFAWPAFRTVFPDLVDYVRIGMKKRFK